MNSILPIVEGDGDIEAVPELIRRIAFDQGIFDLQICRPHKRGDMPKVLGRFEDYLKVALLEEAPILWVMDYDCVDCNDVTRDLEKLSRRATAIANPVPIAFALMVREFESIFISDEATTRRIFPDIPETVAFPADAERIRDAKGWLSSARPKGSAYKPTQHQRKFASQVNLAHLRRTSPSYSRFEKAVLDLIAL